MAAILTRLTALRHRRRAAWLADEVRRGQVFEALQLHHRRQCFSDCPFYHPSPVDTLKV